MRRIEEKQAQEARDKEDADLAQRAAKREAQRAAIDQSRNEVIALKARQARQEKEEEDERQRLQRSKNERMEREEYDKQCASYQRNLDARAAIEAQVADKRAIKDAAREADLRDHARTAAVGGEDEQRFFEIAAGVHADAHGEGKNTIPIHKAMHAKTITLLPASTSLRI